MPPIPIYLVVEDDLSEAVVQRLLSDSGRGFAVVACYGKRGNDYIRRKIVAFNNATRAAPFLVLTDLDRGLCPPELLNSWLPQARHQNLLFRVAVREVEAWLLADRRGFAEFIGRRERDIPVDVETIQDPKEFLVDLVKGSRKRSLREDIVPRPRTSIRIGPRYNEALSAFVRDSWNPNVAAEHSESLRRSIQRIQTFQPYNPL